MIAPAMAVGARIGSLAFGPCCDAFGEQIAPWTQHFEIPLAEPSLDERAIQIVAKVDRAGQKLRISQNAFDQLGSLSTRDKAGENGQRVRMLRETGVRCIVGEELSLRIPVALPKRIG